MKSNNKWFHDLKWIVLMIAFISVLWLIAWPLPDYIEGPGEASNLKSMVKVNNTKNRYRGKLMMTSVGMAPAHPITYLWARLNPVYSVDRAQSVTGDESNQVYDRVQKFYMKSAINNAIYVAYKKAHHYVKPVYRGIYVLNVMPHSRFRSVIKVGDVITKVNHRHFNSAMGYQKYLAHLKHGDWVKIQYLNNGRYYTVTRRLTRLPDGRYGLGVILTDDFTARTKVPVRVNPKQIGGPSGGLMLSLQTYSEAKPVDLTKGRKVAGTGTISPDGEVGEIGGIDKKIIAAKRNHATIFFAPYIKPSQTVLKYEPNHLTNYQLAKRTARKYAPHMKVIPITNFKQAVRYLEET